jgi:hypothetical protein
MSMGTDPFSPNTIQKPKFDLAPEFMLRLNLLMAEDLLDLFDNCVTAHITIPPHIWAMFKQLENWVGETDDDSPRRKSIPR